MPREAQSKRIVVDMGGTVGIRKLAKVVGYGNQGFAVLTPYHSARSGFVAKIPIDYKKIGEFNVAYDDIVGFDTEHRVKLSYHPDGFVQFSGETKGQVTSGRNEHSGEPKGIGLLTQPLSSPIRSGPSFGITAWGLGDFISHNASPQETDVVFGLEDMYFRGINPRQANAIVLEVFALPLRYWAGVRKRGSDYVLTMAFEDFQASRAAIEMKVIDLPNQEVLLAGFVSHTRVEFGSQSGWVLNGPGNRNDDGIGHVLQAFYPREVVPGDRESLDRT